MQLDGNNNLFEHERAPKESDDDDDVALALFSRRPGVAVSRTRLRAIFAATTHIGMIRERATEICIGLQDLELPAFVTLAIVDEAVHENSIRMWAKWELITAVKHFHQRVEARSEA